MPRIALDTNVVVYSEGLERSSGDLAKIGQSRALIQALAASSDEWIIPAQVLAELHYVLVRRGERSVRQASLAAARLAELCTIAPTTEVTLDAAFVIAVDHRLQIYDAIILAAASEAGCDLLLTEDLHDGFVWRGVTVANPFGPTPDPRLAGLLGDAG